MALGLIAVAATLMFAVVDRTVRFDSASTEAHTGLADRLRQHYFRQEFERGYEEGRARAESIGQRDPDMDQLEAWTILNGVKTSHWSKAKEFAQSIQARGGTPTAWNRFAVAAALVWDRQVSDELALSAVSAALASAPRDIDFVWLHAEALRVRHRPDDAVAFLRRNAAEFGKLPELLNIEGAALYDKALRADTSSINSARTSALAAFSASRKADPENINAHHAPGWYLLRENRASEAYPLLRKASELTDSLRVHATFWSAMVGKLDSSLDWKRERVDSDISRLMQTHGQDAQLLYNAAAIYGQLGMSDDRASMEQKLLDRAPDSPQAEQLLMSRLSVQGRRGIADNVYRVDLWRFIRRPVHHNPVLLANARRLLFDSLKGDVGASEAELLEAIEEVASDPLVPPPIAFAQTAVTLADRTSHLKRAESLALQGVASLSKPADPVPAAINARMADLSSSSGDKRRPLEATMRDALGWVYFKSGRMNEAERELALAHRLDGDDPRTLGHLAELHAKSGDLEALEDFWIKCMGLPTGSRVPCEDQILNQFKSTRADAGGFDSYMANLRRAAERARVQQVASAMEVEQAPLPRFELRALDGTVVTSESLRGKVLVIGFFGTWCPVCRAEAPFFDAFARKFGSLSDVSVLKISNDTNVEMVQTWMKRSGYAFSVLMDDGYMKSAGVTQVPTTWFVDRTGRIAFRHHGLRKDLEREFSMRVEILRALPAAGTTLARSNTPQVVGGSLVNDRSAR